MNNLIGRMLTALSFAVLLFAGEAYAQFVPRIVQVNIPFDFTVGEEAFPAGEYTLVSMAQHRVDLRDSHRHVLASLITHSVQSLDKSASTRAMFSTSGDGHALRQVWIKGELIGDELEVPKRSTHVAQRNQHKPAEIASGGNK
jgi:hypothetical protein